MLKVLESEVRSRKSGVRNETIDFYFISNVKAEYYYLPVSAKYGAFEFDGEAKK